MSLNEIKINAAQTHDLQLLCLKTTSAKEDKLSPIITHTTYQCRTDQGSTQFFL